MRQAQLLTVKDIKSHLDCGFNRYSPIVAKSGETYIFDWFFVGYVVVNKITGKLATQNPFDVYPSIKKERANTFSLILNEDFRDEVDYLTNLKEYTNQDFPMTHGIIYTEKEIMVNNEWFTEVSDIS